MLQTLPRWLTSVHHDGSPWYVSVPHPRLGQTVRVRLRTAVGAPIRRAFLRICPDGEEALLPLAPAADRSPARWWEATLAITEPVVRYRFTLEAEDGVWFYSAAGPSAHDPLDALDFRLLAGDGPPSWLAGAVFYQVFPDRFANGDPAHDPRPEEYVHRGARPRTFPWGTPPPPDQPFPLVFYGGDLPGLIQRLDHLARLGANALYLTPIFTAPSNHKYDVADYEHVDPHLGGDAALARLRQALDARGMRYLLDLVPNHVGATHPWFEAAQADSAAPEAEFFVFEEHPDRYLSWMGVRSLPKLDYRSAELFRRMVTGKEAVVRRWLRPPFSADGWRVDVANMLGRAGEVQLAGEVARAMRRAVKEARPDAYLLGEHFYDASDMLQGDQWDGVMNYAGFAAPLWTWLRGYRLRTRGIDPELVSPVPSTTAALETAWRMRRAVVPWSVTLCQYNLLGSHDVPRIRTALSGNDALHRLAAAVQFTSPGLPAIYYGDEIGMEDLPGLHQRGCMVWDEARWNRSLFAYHQELVTLRRTTPALQEGGFQVLAVEADTLAYQREGAEGRVVVVAHRGAEPRAAGPLPVSDGGLPDGLELTERFSGRTATVEGGRLPLPEQSQGATVWIARREPPP
ncbi:MAG TPA: alpha-amylase family glycosyl hydrolase [Anaeromyxobacter sp.]|nr:alpha-amylase family glycosyl hydrolase [Anaeromyxobacter sp.]